MTYESDQISCPFCDCTEFDEIWLISHNLITATCMCCGKTIEITNDSEGSFIRDAELVRL